MPQAFPHSLALVDVKDSRSRSLELYLSTVTAALMQHCFCISSVRHCLLRSQGSVRWYDVSCLIAGVCRAGAFTSYISATPSTYEYRHYRAGRGGASRDNTIDDLVPCVWIWRALLSVDSLFRFQIMRKHRQCWMPLCQYKIADCCL